MGEHEHEHKVFEPGSYGQAAQIVQALRAYGLDANVYVSGDANAGVKLALESGLTALWGCWRSPRWGVTVVAESGGEILGSTTTVLARDTRPERMAAVIAHFDYTAADVAAAPIPRVVIDPNDTTNEVERLRSVGVEMVDRIARCLRHHTDAFPDTIEHERKRWLERLGLL